MSSERIKVDITITATPEEKFEYSKLNAERTRIHSLLFSQYEDVINSKEFESYAEKRSQESWDLLFISDPVKIINKTLLELDRCYFKMYNFFKDVIQRQTERPFKMFVAAIQFAATASNEDILASYHHIKLRDIAELHVQFTQEDGGILH